MANKLPDTGFNVDVLVFKDEGQFSAVAINMDIWGHGDKINEAVEECMGNVAAQVSFALQKEDLSLLDFPSEQCYLDMFKEARLDELKRKYLKSAAKRAAKRKAYAVEAPLPETLPELSFSAA